uniref:Uncharacterized protein n=1 Tax=Caenorhabditis japonica TaxID=281687 RepID=A0A8R1HVU6_CAEJA
MLSNFEEFFSNFQSINVSIPARTGFTDTPTLPKNADLSNYWEATKLNNDETTDKTKINDLLLSPGFAGLPGVFGASGLHAPLGDFGTCPLKPMVHSLSKEKKPRSLYKKRDKNQKKPGKFQMSDNEVIGPPFKYEYAPHLRCDDYRVENAQQRKTKSSDILLLKRSVNKKRCNAPSAKKMSWDESVDLATLLSKTNQDQPSYGSETMANPLFPVISNYPENFLLRNPLMPVQIGYPFTHLLSPDIIQNVANNLNVSGNRPPITSPLSPNQKVYVKLKEQFPKWRMEYFMKHGLIMHNNALLKKRMIWLLKQPGYTIEFWKIEHDFRVFKFELFSKLSRSERAHFTTAFLQNCAEFEAKFRKKEEEVDGDQFYYWMEEQINNELNKNLKGHLINALLYDWSDPKLNPQRIVNFSIILKIAVPRVFEIFEEVREKVKFMIRAREYYWSIDQDIPSLE